MRLRVVVFPDRTVQLSAGRIEVAERDIAKAIGIGEVFHHVFDDQFRAAIDIGRIVREIFFNRRFFRFTIDSGRGREYDLGNARFLHAKKQVKRTLDIIRIILGRTTMDSPTRE